MIQVNPAQRIEGTVCVPGDKSISHRSLLFGAVGHGQTIISNLSTGADVCSTRAVLQQMGVPITDGRQGTVVVDGRGFESLREPSAPLDCGNSGTTMRLLMGLLAGCPLQATLVGDSSLSGRPMERIATPMRRMGTEISLSPQGTAPVTLRGKALKGIEYNSPVASAQIKSAVLLAGLQAAGQTVVDEPAQSRDHTERMLRSMGAKLTVEGTRVTLRPGPLKSLGHFHVPGDLSSAAFLLAAGVLLDGDGVTVRSVCINPSRTGFLDALRSMGSNIEESHASSGAEPCADLRARRTPLQPLQLSGEGVVRAIDEIPILAVLATQAQGRSVIADAAELRVKESDRLAETTRFLQAMGAQVEERPDGLIIEGPTPLHSAEVYAGHDHRIGMAAAIAALVAREGPTTIHGSACVGVSYPDFFTHIAQLTH
jgi:3-phosphoshikimate 1-carboxyvinyltransferase